MLVSCQALSGCQAVRLSGAVGYVRTVRAVGAVGFLSGAVHVPGTSYIVREMAMWSKFLVLTMDQEFAKNKTQQCNSCGLWCSSVHRYR